MIKLSRLPLAIRMVLFLILPSFTVAAQDNSNREMITVENVTSVTEIAALEGHEGTANSVAFSPDGRLLASGNSEGEVRIWDIENGGEPLLLNAQDTNGQNKAVTALAFSSDGTLLAAGGHFWNVSLRVCRVYA